MLGAGLEGLELPQLVCHETPPLEQIHGGVAREHELGQHHHVRSRARCPGGSSLHEAAVSGEVADDGVYLCEGNLHERKIGWEAGSVKRPALRRRDSPRWLQG